MDIIKLLVLALSPVLAVILYIYLRDKYEKEPLRLLISCFFWGIISIIPAAYSENKLGELLSLSENNPKETFIYAFFIVGLSEELCKFLFLVILTYKNKNFNEPFDGIVYAVMVSMGFAAAENVMYVYQGGENVAWLRMFTAIPAHATFGILMGYYVGKSKFAIRYKLFYLIYGLVIAVIFHGTYDLFLMLNQYSGLAVFSILTLIIAIIVSLKSIKKSSENSPFRRWTFK